MGATGVAAAAAAIVALGSSAAPAFAGWRSKPTIPAPGQLAQAAQACGHGLGSPILTDSRGPYTASIYTDSTTTDVCLSGNDVSMSSISASGAPSSVPSGHIQLDGEGTRDAAGDALTLVDGWTAADVTAVTINRSDGSSVQATVHNGWYLAWWPGTVTATTATITTPTGTNTVAFPSTPAVPAVNCPSGSRCASGYSFGSGASGGTVIRGGSASAGQSATTVHRSSASSSQ